VRISEFLVVVCEREKIFSHEHVSECDMGEKNGFLEKPTLFEIEIYFEF
jgi:hypothetical protein